MIKINETKRYNVKPLEVISDAFETAYTRYAEEQPVAPPDLAMPVFTSLSMVLLFVLFLLTAFEYKDEKHIWFILAGLCIILAGRSCYKYFIQNKQYKQAAGKPSVVKAKRDGFFSFFQDDEDLPETTTAANMLKMVSPIIGKQNDQVYNNALREMSEDLARINNPSLTMCKLLTPCGEIFKQSRRRLYFKDEGAYLVFFDTDWMNPLGEIVCDEDDVVSFGEYSKYPSDINKSGGKIRQDSIIVEIKDADNHIFFEFQNDSYAELKKALSSRKEKK
ncbi:MAG: hypothetical protein E7387_00710 [Ruminococcaceae bacterium]|nr:hypothetical protein [Oscillospiraceae bacterium]